MEEFFADDALLFTEMLQLRNSELDRMLWLQAT